MGADMKYLVKNKVTIIITSIFVISLTLLWNYTSSNIDKVIRVFGNSYISNLEPDSYNSKFNEINYKNIKILYKFYIFIVYFYTIFCI